MFQCIIATRPTAPPDEVISAIEQHGRRTGRTTQQ